MIEIDELIEIWVRIAQGSSRDSREKMICHGRPIRANSSPVMANRALAVSTLFSLLTVRHAR